MKILFGGDPHGDFSTFNESLIAGGMDAAILLGDLCAERSLDEEIVSSAVPLWWVVGNHDCDDARWYDNAFGSSFAKQEFTGRVLDVGGVRIAGLGGVFRRKIWYPPEPPVYQSRDEFVSRMGKGNRWRGGLPLRHRASIWYDDYQALANQTADVLVTHEAPASHRHGCRAVDELAKSLGARLIVHGHVHENYRRRVSGIDVVSIGLAAARILDL